MPNNLKLFSLLVIVALFAVSSAINENDESNVMKKNILCLLNIPVISH
ncbi:hypothetical protein I3679_014590 [Proteus mirabilis]|uniref:Uncharacterized protein n=1 Tax=Proteus mirabilis TaxID=584 RepID=A0ABD5LYN2_PROMI